MHILLEHVRSFSTRQEVPVRPLTLLVGENSSGKSTFLAIAACLLDQNRFPSALAFNEPPYSLGSYDTIATHRGGRHGRASSFTVGFTVGRESALDYRRLEATFENHVGSPVLRRLLAATGESGLLSFDIKGTSLSGEIVHPSASGGRGEVIPIAEVLPTTLGRQGYLPAELASALGPRLRTGKDPAERWFYQALGILTDASLYHAGCASFAPIRSKPRRTYDELSDEYSPEGDHIPTVLARLFREEPTSQTAQHVRAALLEFGEISGLFKKVAVRALGREATDPFQLQVTVAGPPVNLVDVGYGVSQLLPIIVQSVLRGPSTAILMQQPEVHLHPRAQAALGTYFAKLAANQERLFLVETHSDYLVDRVRQEVAAGTIAADRVMILFFHKPQMDTTVYPITLDEHGNVENAPPEYRSFFLREELNLLSRTGG